MLDKHSATDHTPRPENAFEDWEELREGNAVSTNFSRYTVHKVPSFP